MKFMILPGAPLALGLGADLEAGRVDQQHDRHVEGVAQHMEVDDLAAGVGASAPPLKSGLLAMMPTLLPPRRARPVTRRLPKRGFSSKKLSLSTMPR